MASLYSRSSFKSLQREELHGYHAAHNLNTLFDQLGLPSDAVAIKNFIHWHRPLDPNTPLRQAPWWTPAQAEFLAQAIEEDSDWAEQVDELDALLRPAREMT